jgi:sugar phosphate isomerase/epimerase
MGMTAETPAPERRGASRIGVSTYSFWHFHGEPPSIESCLEQAAEMGFDGGEILHVHSLDIDYDRVAKLLRKHNYRGYVSLEMEGKEAPATAIPQSLSLLRRAFGA